MWGNFFTCDIILLEPLVWTTDITTNHLQRHPCFNELSFRQPFPRIWRTGYDPEEPNIKSKRLSNTFINLATTIAEKGVGAFCWPIMEVFLAARFKNVHNVHLFPKTCGSLLLDNQNKTGAITFPVEETVCTFLVQTLHWQPLFGLLFSPKSV